ncbi:MAG: hypothetical protein KQ78_01777 [Candidatus Izimaplasma bacterium HR2]|nr:MAG: hypothetical protein KQ78_01777 [Candidatus Izimaplasma bacterium HR2]
MHKKFKDKLFKRKTFIERILSNIKIGIDFSKDEEVKQKMRTRFYILNQELMIINVIIKQ